jgi:hypothetical protein
MELKGLNFISSIKALGRNVIDIFYLTPFLSLMKLDNESLKINANWNFILVQEKLRYYL